MERANPNHDLLRPLLQLGFLAFFTAMGFACGGGEDETPVGTNTSSLASASAMAVTPTPARTSGASPGAMPSSTPVPTAASTSAAPTSTATVPTPDRTPPSGGDQAAAGQAARDALARWLGPAGDRSAVSVASVEAVTWPDGCLGLPRPGVLCTQSLVAGFRVILELGDGTYEVRMDAARSTVKWAPSVQVMVRFFEASTNVVQFATDDGGLLVVQAVPGTSFGIPLSELEPGETAAVGLAERPQGDGFVLVWLDPVGP